MAFTESDHTESDHSQQPAQPRRRGRWVLRSAAALVALAVVVGGAKWLADRRTVVRRRAEIEQISSSAAQRVVVRPMRLHGLARHVVDPRLFEEVVELNLANCGFVPGSLQWLEPFGSLEAISLFNTSANDDELRHLTRFKHLRSLNLMRTFVEGPGLAHLHAPGIRLEELWIDQMSDAKVVHFRGLTHLRTLSIAADPDSLTVPGIETLVGGLPKLKALKIFGATSLSKADIQRIKNTRPNLEVMLIQ